MAADDGRRRIGRVGALALLAPLAGAVACGSGDPHTIAWEVSLDGAPGAILSFWSGTGTDVFAAGGTLAKDGGAGYVWRFDGKTWHEMPTGTESLWWIHGFSATDLWVVGERGTIARFDGSTWQTVETGKDYTLWGIWGPSPDRLWAIGGAVVGGHPGVVRSWNGSTWADVAEVDGTGELFFKVWGTSATDVHVVGDHGTTLHFDGSSWTKTKPVTDRLLTVRGRADDDVFAVGGLTEGVVIHRDASGTWSRLDTDVIAGLMGLWTAPGRAVVTSGFQGAMMVGDDTGWHAVRPLTHKCLHAVWSDGRGTWFAGGGDLFTPAMPAGIILVGHGQPRPALVM